MIVRGQIHGGIAQGIGQALVEHAIYDRESGQMLAATFMDYGMPRARPLPGNRDAARRDAGQDQSARASRASARCGTIGAPPTIINAMLDALKPLGVDGDRHAGDAGAGVGDDPARQWRRRGTRLIARAIGRESGYVIRGGAARQGDRAWRAASGALVVDINVGQRHF